VDADAVRIFVLVLRSLRRWNPAQMGAAVELDDSTIHRYERGEITPDTTVQRQLMAAVKLPAELGEGLALPCLQVLVHACELADAAAGGGPPSRPHDGLLYREHVGAMLAHLGVGAMALYRQQLVELEQHALSEARTSPAQLREAATRAWASLTARTTGERSWLVEHLPELHTWAFVERAGEESVRAAADEPARALEVARLAVQAAGAIAGREGERPRGLARAYLGNALRAGGRLLEAEAAFATGWEHWHAGAGSVDGLGEWRLLDLEASLRREQRRFPNALELLDRALLQAPDEWVGRILLNKALVFEQAGDVQESVTILDVAARWIPQSGDRRLIFGAAFNLAVNLCHLRRFEEAQAHLPQLQALAVSLANEMDQARVQWLKGRVAAGLGERTMARDELQDVARAFELRNNALGAATVSLEIAILALEEGRTAEVRQLAAGMHWIFKSNHIEREALAALRLFCDAAEQERTTLDQAKLVLTLLEDAMRRNRGWATGA
jgi:tetratricopeptide (TPR) repeat protein